MFLISANRLRTLAALFVGAILLFVAALAAGIAAMNHALNEQQREFVRSQITNLKTGGTEGIVLTDSVGMTEFLDKRRVLDGAGPFELRIEYADGVDDFLKQIADQHGLKALVLHKTDTTTVGIKSIARLPDLEKLSIWCIRPGAGEWLVALRPHRLADGLEPLRDAAKLMELTVCVEGIPDEDVDDLRSRLPSCQITVEHGY